MRINEILTEDSAQPIGEPLLVPFHELHEIMKSKYRVDLYDVYGSQRATDKWYKANKMPRHVDVKTQQDQFTQFNNDPTGRNALPPYYNFWHFIIDWAAANGNAKTITISRDIVPEQQTFSEQQRETIFKYFVAQAGLAGQEPSDEFYRAIADMFVVKETKAKGTKKVVDLILAHYLGPITIKTGY